MLPLLYVLCCLGACATLTVRFLTIDHEGRLSLLIGTAFSVLVYHCLLQLQGLWRARRSTAVPFDLWKEALDGTESVHAFPISRRNPSGWQFVETFTGSSQDFVIRIFALQVADRTHRYYHFDCR